MAPMDLAFRDEAGESLPMLVWRPPAPVYAISSAPLGGGLGRRYWVVNATVPSRYAREDPQNHLGELADGLDLRGPGVGLLTAVPVTKAVTTTDDGVTVTATVGLDHPTWAADADGHLRHHPPGRRAGVGTINIVAWLPVPMSESALVNAVATATEAKVQALIDCGIPATGTATDALCIATPEGPPAEAFGGPRSRWGARLARAVFEAVRAGAGPWTDDQPKGRAARA